MGKRIYLTVDVECHDIKRRNQYIDGKCSKGKYGLEKILILGKKNDIPINFFFDIVEMFEYGESYVLEIVSLIQKYEQNIYFHLHPNYVTKNHEKSFLWQYTYDEKKNILKKGFDLYKRIMGKNAKVFRIGRYGADSEMYKAMKELGIKTIDLSYSCYNNKMCHLSSKEVVFQNVPFQYFDQMIFPNTRYLAFNLFGKKLYSNLDTNDTTYDEFKRFIRKTKLTQITITMHSWNFISKLFFAKEYVGACNSAVEKFDKMVNYAKENGFVFYDLASTPPQIGLDEDEVIDMCEGLLGKLRMLVNNYVRFKKIAHLNKKYFLIYLIFYSLLLIGTLIVLSIIIR